MPMNSELVVREAVTQWTNLPFPRRAPVAKVSDARLERVRTGDTLMSKPK